MGVLLREDLPEELWAALEAAGYTPARLSEEAFRHYAAVLYGRKVLTIGQAARLAGMSLWDFIPFLGSQGIPVADYDEQETTRELDTARWLANTPQE